MHWRLYFVLLPLFLVVSLSASAQDRTGEVTGRIVNSRDNGPLGLVQVELTGTSFRTVTAEDGTFRLSAVPIGNYVLQAATVGYYSNRIEFSLSAFETKNIEIVLTSSTAKRTENVDVIADVFEADAQPSASGFTLEGEERKNLGSVLA